MFAHLLRAARERQRLCQEKITPPKEPEFLFDDALLVGNESAFGDDVEDLAKVLSSASGLQIVSGVAREAAEAQLDLSRIRKIRDCLYQMIYFVDGPASERLAELNDKLAKLERYERRAFSRRRRALRAI